MGDREATVVKSLIRRFGTSIEEHEIIETIARTVDYDYTKAHAILIEMCAKITVDSTEPTTKPNYNQTRNNSHAARTNSPASTTGAIPRNNRRNNNNNHPQQRTRSTNNLTIHKSKKEYEIEKTIGRIETGSKLLIILRGLPGSGKSHLASQLIERAYGGRVLLTKDVRGSFVFNTDDFFIRNGRYQFARESLQEAHAWNQKRANGAMMAGVSPVIIDNTNIQTWEMRPYVFMATQFGYYIQVLEPATAWATNERELVKRNIHSVPREKIKLMKENYEENVTGDKLLHGFGFRYIVVPPQRRSYPSFNTNSPFHNNPQPLMQTPILIPHVQVPYYAGVNIINPQPQMQIPLLQQPQIPHPPQKQPQNQIPPLIPNKTAPSSSSDNNNQLIFFDDILTSQTSPVETPLLKPTSLNNSKQNIADIKGTDTLSAWGLTEDALISWDVVKSVSCSSKSGTTPSVTTSAGGKASAVTTTLLSSSSSSNVVPKKVMSTVMTNTSSVDFARARGLVSDDLEGAGYVKMLTATGRDITKGGTDVATPVLKLRKAMFEKGTMTNELMSSSLDRGNKDNDISELQALFNKIPLEYLRDVYEKCNCDLNWTVELLLDDNNDILENIPDKNNSSPSPMEHSTSHSSSPSTSPIQFLHTTGSYDDYEPPNNPPTATGALNQEIKRNIESLVQIGNDFYSEHVLKLKQRRSGTTTGTAGTAGGIVREGGSEKLVDCMEIDDFEFDNVDSSEDEGDYNKADDENVEKLVELNLGAELVSQLEKQCGDPGLKYPLGFQPIIEVPDSFARQLYAFYLESVYGQLDAQTAIYEEMVAEDNAFARQLQRGEEQRVAEEEEEIERETARLREVNGETVTELEVIMGEQARQAVYERGVEATWKSLSADDLASKLTRQKLFSKFKTVDKDTLLEILVAHKNNYAETVEVLLATGLTMSDDEVNNVTVIDDRIVQDMKIEEEKTKQDDFDDIPKSADEYREEAFKYQKRREELMAKAQSYHQNGMGEVASFYSNLARKQSKFYERSNGLAAVTFLREHANRLDKFDTLDLHYLHAKEAVPALDIFLDRNINLLKGDNCKQSETLYIITGRGKHSRGGRSVIKPITIQQLRRRNIKFSIQNEGLLRIKVFRNTAITSDLE